MMDWAKIIEMLWRKARRRHESRSVEQRLLDQALEQERREEAIRTRVHGYEVVIEACARKGYWWPGDE